MSGAIGHVVAVLPAFVLACVVLAALPGRPPRCSCTGPSGDGRRPGLAAVAGNEIGIFCWALAAGAGLAAVLRAGQILFSPCTSSALACSATSG